MAKRNRTAPKARTRRTDLDRLLGQFSDTRSILTSAVRSLEERDSAGVSDEAVCLRHGLDLLGEVYDGLDLAILTMRDSDDA